MNELWVALAFVLVIEGALYALFPRQMRTMALRMTEVPEATLRSAGLVAAVVGVLVVWAVR
ncbi:MAG: DUF2065 domain-containing protein [Alphaproteobacteria bacterium]